MMELTSKGRNGAKSVKDWKRTVRGIRSQIEDPESVAQAIEIMNAMRDEIESAIQHLQEEEGYSWTELAKPVGVSRQAMRQRWGRKMDANG